MLTEIQYKKLPNGRRVSEFAGLSTDTKPVYRTCEPQPTKDKFEADKTHYYTKSGDTYTQCTSETAYGTVAGNFSMTQGSCSFNSATFLSKVSSEVGEYAFTATVGIDATRTVTAESGSALTTDTCTFTKATFLAYTQTTTNFVYDGTEWFVGEEAVTLADYGLAITEGTTLADGDKITVSVSHPVTWKSGEDTVTISQYGVTNVSGVITGTVLTLTANLVPETFYECVPLNGSTIFCMDTKCKYMFDEDGAEWKLIEGTEGE